MRHVVIDMQALFAAAVGNALSRSDFGFDTVQSQSPKETLPLCLSLPADILLMDVMSFAPRTLEERLSLRDTLKRANPHCKIVLMVDENGEKKVADRVRLARKDGLIDGFLYNSTSGTYLAAVMDTL